MEKLQTREKENTRSGMGKGRILALTLPIFVELLLQLLVQLFHLLVDEQ